MLGIESSPRRCPKCNKIVKYTRKNIGTYLVNNERLRCKNKNCDYLFSKEVSKKIWESYSDKKMVSVL
jgi:hypothetical protein